MRANRRKALGLVLALLLTLIYFSPAQAVLRRWPESMTLTEAQWQALTLPGPLTLQVSDTRQPVEASMDERLMNETEGTAATLSLLGLPLRQTQVRIAREKRLIPGGMAIGVAMYTEGVLVVGTGGIGGEPSPAAQCGLRPGDVLCRINEVEVTSAEQLTELIAQAGASPLPVEYLRDGERRQATLTPVQDAATGTVRMGAWVRDSTAGVGTLTFYDPASGSFAALGHAITDGDTGQVLTVADGQVLHADVVAVQKGARGKPGELKGSFLREREVLGRIAANTDLGMYGSLAAPPAQTLYPDGLPVGYRSGVHTGPAQILSTVSGEGMSAYDVEITRVNRQNAPAAKSMVLKVTDPRLLEATGGIVQGMSGSPIIQDGRLIGAVTHVFVSDPTQGYGLYIDWMLDAADQLGLQIKAA